MGLLRDELDRPGPSAVSLRGVFLLLAAISDAEHVPSQQLVLRAGRNAFFSGEKHCAFAGNAVRLLRDFPTYDLRLLWLPRLLLAGKVRRHSDYCPGQCDD